MADGDRATKLDLERVRRVKERVAPQLLRRPGVTAVGVGREEKGGVLTGRLALRVYVRRKGSFPPGERLPHVIEGVPVEVVEAEFTPAMAAPAGVAAPRPAGPRIGPEACPDGEMDVDTTTYDPLVGGISAGALRFPLPPYGTAGLVVAFRDRAEPPMLLSCAHVFCGSDGMASAGDRVLQPAPAFDGAGECATLTRWYLGNVWTDGVEYGVDAAVAAIDLAERGATLRSVMDIGTVSGIRVAQPGDLVEKRGATSLLTTGTVKGVYVDLPDVDAGPPYGVVTLKNQIEIESLSPGSFASFGDSGSVVVDQGTRQVVGLLFYLVNGGAGALANPIEPVLQVLDIML